VSAASSPSFPQIEVLLDIGREAGNAPLAAGHFHIA
jgi:hypothetical protein